MYTLDPQGGIITHPQCLSKGPSFDKGVMGLLFSRTDSRERLVLNTKFKSFPVEHEAFQ